MTGDRIWQAAEFGFVAVVVFVVLLLGICLVSVWYDVWQALKRDAAEFRAIRDLCSDLDRVRDEELTALRQRLREL